MRPLPPQPAAAATVVAAVAAESAIIHLSPPLSPSTPTKTRCEPQDDGCNRWQPYSNSRDFEANAATVLIILLCALICALVLNTAIRCFLRGGGGVGGNNPQQSLPQNQQQEQQEVQHDERKSTLEKEAADTLIAGPSLVFSTGMKLAGTEAECAICLSEFVEGEGIRVLGRCNHGFHVNCIQQWLSSHASCPTCRRSCLPPSPIPTQPCSQTNTGEGPILSLS